MARIAFKKVEENEIPPLRKTSHYQNLRDELKQMPNQWVRLEKPGRDLSQANGISWYLKRRYGLDSKIRAAEGEPYHVYVRYVEAPNG